MKVEELTLSTIDAAMEVHKQLGNSFQEIIYQRDLAIEMTDPHIGYSRAHDFKGLQD